MGFGISDAPANMTGRTTNNSVQVARATDNMGNNREQTTYGLVTQVQEDTIVVGTFANAAIDGQTGEDVVTAHNLTEGNTAYATVQKTRDIIPGGGLVDTVTTTTTTTTTE